MPRAKEIERYARALLMQHKALKGRTPEDIYCELVLLLIEQDQEKAAEVFIALDARLKSKKA